ncbi:MAG: hypothetical protein R6V10_13700 [bacterium]
MAFIKKGKQEKTGTAAGKLSVMRLAGTVFFLAVLAFSFSCNEQQKEDSGLSPEEKAKKRILDSFILPPEAEFQKVEVMPEKNMLIASYGSTESVDYISEFFKQRIKREGLEIVQEFPNGLNYRNKQGKQIGVAWFSRDPDLSEYQCVFRISYLPLPPELKPAEAEEEKAPGKKEAKEERE